MAEADSTATPRRPQDCREARATTSAALADLRTVVRGIHPPVLADRGLDGAVQALALDMAMPVQVDGHAGRAAAAARRVRGLLRGRRVPGQLRQARRPPAAWVGLSHDDGRLRVEVGDDGAGGADVGRAAPACRGGAPAGGLRRHTDGVQPGRRADGRPRGGAVRAVIAEDHALLRDGLTRLLEGTTSRWRRGRQRRRWSARCATHADVAVIDVRMPPTFTDEGLRAAIEVRAERPGLPVLVLSQYVEQLYARELLSSGEGAVGYLLKDRVADVGGSSTACAGCRRRHRARPGGGLHAAGPAARPSRWTGSPPASARCWR